VRRALTIWLLGCALALGAARAGETPQDCLARSLALPADGLVPAGQKVAFAVMELGRGRVLWRHNDPWLAQLAVSPGSVFKLAAAHAALSGRRIDPHMTQRCAGRDREPPLGGVRCWQPAGHGPVNLGKALALSCNRYFAWLGQELGVEPILASARELGLGRSTGSDLPGEVAGSLPASLGPQDASRLAVGQVAGLRVTPLQLLSLVGAVASGGALLSPRLAPGGGPPRGVAGDPEALRYLRAALEEASAFGTGSRARLGPLGLAGKTGTTAWEEVPWRTHAWYVGFWPARRPTHALVVFVHEGQGAEEAAGLAGRLVERVERARAACGGGPP